MIYRLAIGVLAALAVAIIVPAQAPADPPTKCLTSTVKGKQVYVPCDLLNAGANFPPGSVVPNRSISIRKTCRTGVAHRPIRIRRARARRVLPARRALQPRRVL